MARLHRGSARPVYGLFAFGRAPIKEFAWPQNIQSWKAPPTPWATIGSPAPPLAHAREVKMVPLEVTRGVTGLASMLPAAPLDGAVTQRPPPHSLGHVIPTPMESP